MRKRSFEKLVEIDEVVKQMRIPEPTLNHWVKEGLFPSPVGGGKSLKWMQSEINKWKASQKAASTSINLNATSSEAVPTQVKINLPSQGLSRWSQIKPFCPFSKETFRKLVLAGRAPQPIRFNSRSTAYSNEQLTAFFKSPLTYRAEGGEK